MSAHPRPDVFAFLDHRAYLTAWFEWKKSANPRFSHRMFARMAGQRSPSLAHLVMKGERNLTDRTTPAFCKAMALDAEESRFFHSLVRFDATTDPDERNALWNNLAASKRFQAAQHIKGEAFNYLSHWFIPAVRELAGCAGFQADPAWIARTLRPRITPAQAQQALATLRDLGMLVESDGELVPREDTVVTPHEVVVGLAVYNYHQGMIARSSEAIMASRPAERHMGALTVAVPQSLVPELKDAIVAFQERLLDLCDSKASAADRVYQVNLHLFPLSEPIQEPQCADSSPSSSSSD
ncbi:MAG: hypothetical protein ACI8PZ_005526 [Myxococcota bacterium]|jgi:uncharacterized protein (TIGR02147 family)